MDAARARAREMAQRIAQRLASSPFDKKQYLYGERPLPEPVLREFRNRGSDPGAVVTRNVYGSLVLNARDLMFVDIDQDDGRGSGQAAPGLVSGVLSLFGKSAPAPPKPDDPVLGGIQRVAESNRLAARVYKTAAGYRAIITNTRFSPGDARSEALLQQFGSDPLYVRLCRMQQSFRARLTPKPWRCGVGLPPVSFPFDTPQAETRFRAWEAGYTSTAERYATCRYLTTFGGVRFDAGFEELVDYHDRETRASSALPLA